MIVVFDLETGGVQDHHPDIQLAAIALDTDLKEVESFERKIQFNEADADPEALKLNHYDREIWAREAKALAKVISEFSRFIEQYRSIEMVSKRTGAPYSVARLAGYNAATFDGPRLKRMYASANAFLPAHPQVMCVMQRAIWYFAETGERIESLKLAKVCEHFGISTSGAHDALTDVRLTVELMRIFRVRREVAA